MCVCACVCVCVGGCVGVCEGSRVFSINGRADSQPEDPLELIEEHKGADITLRVDGVHTHL